MFKSIVLFTNNLKSLMRFYGNVLELDISKASDERFTLKVGETTITFIQSDRPACYHIAINIPGNQFSMMKYWMKERVSLNRDEGRDEIYFPSFDADSMYFDDPVGNVVELIGRRKRDLFGDLTNASFLNVSEIAIATPFVTEVGEQLQDFGIALHGETEANPGTVNFFGKGDAYIVLVRASRKWYFSEKISETHPLEFTLTDGLHVVLDEEGKVMLSRKTMDD